MEQDDKPAVCSEGSHTGPWTQEVSVVLLFAPGLKRPYPLVPGEPYHICTACDAVYLFVSRAADAHPHTRQAGPWTRAVVIYADGHGSDIRARRPDMATA